MKPKITMRKYNGDDAYSWAVFVNGQPVITGLTQSEARYHKGQIAKIWEEK